LHHPGGAGASFAVDVARVHPPWLATMATSAGYGFLSAARNMNQRTVAELWEALLGEIDPDYFRPGLLHTPERIARFYAEFFNPPEPQLTEFESDGYDQMIVEREISFVSLCEHHVLPFFGTAAIGYLPSNGRIVGLSKLARLVDYYAHRLQVQERLTLQIAEHLRKELSPDVGVVLRAQHLCVSMRGVCKPGVWVETSRLLGKFRESSLTRSEFMALARQAI